MKSVQNCTRFIYSLYILRCRSPLGFLIIVYFDYFPIVLSIIDSDKIFDYFPIILSVLNQISFFRLFSDCTIDTQSYKVYRLFSYCTIDTQSILQLYYQYVIGYVSYNRLALVCRV